MSLLSYLVGGVLSLCGLVIVAYLVRDIYFHFWKPVTGTGWRPNNFELAERDIVELIGLADKYIYIAAGGASEFWGRPAVQNALRLGADKLGVENVVVALPTDIEGRQENPLVHLAEEGVITLRFAGRDLQRHFRIADGKHYTLEWPHPHGVQTRYYNAIRNDERGGREVLAEFANIVVKG